MLKTLKQWIERIKIYKNVRAGDIIYGYTPVSRKELEEIHEYHKKKTITCCGEGTW